MVLKLTSKFKPFTFDEMVKPLQMYKEAYDKVEEQYADLSTQTEMWRDIANKTNSPEAYEMFRRYADQLQAVTDDFATGMTLQNRSQLMNMKRRYAAEIIPIQKAKEAYDKMVETREKISSADDSAIFVNHYNSIDDFLHGGTADNTYVSGNKLMARVAAKCEAYGRSEYGKMEIAKTVSRGYQDLYEQKNGYSYADLKEVLAQHPESKAAQDINAIIQSELHAAGYDNLNDFDKSKLANYAESGAYSGLSKPAFQFVDSGKAHAQNYEMENKRLAEQIREANMQDARARQQMALSDKHARWQRADNQAARSMQAAQHNRDTYISLVTSGIDSNTAYKLVYGNIDSNGSGKIKIPDKKQQELTKKITKAGGINQKGNHYQNPDGTWNVQLSDGSYVRYDAKTRNFSNAVNYYNAQDHFKDKGVSNIKGDPAGHFGVTIKNGKAVASNVNPGAYKKYTQGNNDEKNEIKRYTLGNFAGNQYIGGGTHPYIKDSEGMTPEKLKNTNKEAYNGLVNFTKENGLVLSNYRVYSDNGKDFYLIDTRRFPKGTSNRPFAGSSGRTTNSGDLLGNK